MLSELELEVLAAKAEGYTTEEIGGELGLSPQDVKVLLAAARLNLSAKTTCYAVAEAIRDGLM